METRIEFGKHRGKTLAEVPEEYLGWLIGKMERELGAYKGEIERRQLQSEADMPWIEKIVSVGHKTLVARYHPDNADTGNAETFRQVQAAAEELKAALRAGRGAK